MLTLSYTSTVVIDEIFFRLRDAFAEYSEDPTAIGERAKMQVRKAVLKLTSALQSLQVAGSMVAKSSATHAKCQAAGDEDEPSTL